MMTDPIADMLTRIRNAKIVAKPEVSMPASKLKEEIAKILVSEGYIEGYDISTLQGEQTVGSMVVMEDGQPAKKHYRSFRIRSTEGPCPDPRVE